MKVFKILLVIGIALMMLAGCGDTEQKPKEPTAQEKYQAEKAEKAKKKKIVDEYFEKYKFLKDEKGSPEYHYDTLKKIAEQDGMSMEEYAEYRLDLNRKANEAERNRREQERSQNGLTKDKCETAQSTETLLQEGVLSGQNDRNTSRQYLEAVGMVEMCKKRGLLNE
ncbi:hypothetical protein [Bacillus mobilis]|uniref:hypothetical protein n=1 Tax=Bacillus mobilis TaxID=2026190 RepID=UPI0013D41F3D|nr:hypothetical protein [Bacillus mobilis]NEL00388.1 hypothetical protein [Bacillus mobilis]